METLNMEKITRLTQLIDANYDSIKPSDFSEMYNIVHLFNRSKFPYICEDPKIVIEWIENAGYIVELLHLIMDTLEADGSVPDDDDNREIKKEIKVIIDKQKLLLNDFKIKPPQIPRETFIRANNYINTGAAREMGMSNFTKKMFG